MEKIDYVITFLLIVKVLFVVCALYRVYLTHRKSKQNEVLIEKVEYWKTVLSSSSSPDVTLVVVFLFPT